MLPQRNVSFPQLLQIIQHQLPLIEHHHLPAGHDHGEDEKEQQHGQDQSTWIQVMVCTDFQSCSRIKVGMDLFNLLSKITLLVSRYFINGHVTHHFQDRCWREHKINIQVQITIWVLFQMLKHNHEQVQGQGLGAGNGSRQIKLNHICQALEACRNTPQLYPNLFCLTYGTDTIHKFMSLVYSALLHENTRGP